MEQIIERFGNDWTRIEWYMQINGEKIERGFRDIQDNGHSDFGIGNHYKNGSLIEKDDEKIKYTTYTLESGRIVVNHVSCHNLEGNYFRGYVNTFALGIMGFTTKEEADEYVSECIPGEDISPDIQCQLYFLFINNAKN